MGAITRFWRGGALALLGLAMLEPAAAQPACAPLMTAQCLDRLGAGAVALGAVCDGELAAYRQCLSDTAAAAPPPTAAGAACSEAVARDLWSTAQTADDCRAYAAFRDACPGSPQARMAAGLMDRMACAAAGGAGAVDARGPDASPEARAQAKLARLGYYVGPIDGRWGPQSEGALAAFKRDAGIVPPTGVLTQRNLGWLLAAPDP